MRSLVLSTFAIASALSACGPVNRGLESVNQPVVSRTDYAIDMRSAGDGLAMGEDQRLAAWFDSLRLGFGDRVTVDDPAIYGGGSREAVASVAARYGLLLGETPPVTQGPVAPGTVRVIVSRSAATVPNCPNWDSLSQPNFDGSTDSNFGCASNTNLAQMVADPQDLITGRKSGMNGSTRATTRALKAYNDLVPSGASGTVKAEATGGK